MTFKRLAAFAGAGMLALGIVSCSSTGGAPEGSGEGSGGGTVDTPRMTIAMITHEVPGDSFWDLVRKGAETPKEEFRDHPASRLLGLVGDLLEGEILREEKQIYAAIAKIESAVVHDDALEYD